MVQQNKTVDINFRSSALFISFLEIDSRLVEHFINITRWGDVSTVDNMLHEGMPVDIQDENGETALMNAAENNQTNIVILLLKKGADANKQDSDGWTALHNATRTNSVDVIKVLLEYGALTNIPNKDDQTPLELARMSNKEKTVRVLEQYQAKASLQYSLQ